MDKKEYVVEIVKDFDNTFYCNVHIAGKHIKSIPEYVSYSELRTGVFDVCGISIPPLKELNFTKSGRKHYAYAEGKI